jgi:hypothetical protein
MGETGQGSAGAAGGMPDEGRQAILQTKRWLPDRRVVVVADSGFSALEFIAAVRRHVCLITRLRLDASLFEPAPKRRNGQGRPALKGKRRPELSAVLADPKTVWTSVTLTEWYGGQTRNLEYVSQTAVWYHNGMPPAAIRWVLVRDPSKEDAAAIRTTFEQEGELSAAIELRRRFPGITDNARARECVRTIAGWQPPSPRKA